ncbi:MAG: hypothetical protein KAK00_08035, partial [Nanoarchaeota archaeon]|nr:hypothetical protein [Nanoarchaeota archaeon]
MSVSLGVIFGLIAMLGFGLANAISQVPAKALGSRKTVFLRGIFVSILLCILCLFFLDKINFSMKYIMIAFGISLIGYIPLATFYNPNLTVC